MFPSTLLQALPGLSIALIDGSNTVVRTAKGTLFVIIPSGGALFQIAPCDQSGKLKTTPGPTPVNTRVVLHTLLTE